MPPTKPHKQQLYLLSRLGSSYSNTMGWTLRGIFAQCVLLIALSGFYLFQEVNVTKPFLVNTKTNNEDRKQRHAAAWKGRTLNVQPIGTEKDCVTVRFRGSNVSMTMTEAISFLRQSSNRGELYEPLKVGLEFVEHTERFVSFGKGVFHLFHYLEFLVIAYEELHRLGSLVESNIQSTLNTTLSQNSLPIQVPWIYVPLLDKEEICGVAKGINCLIADIILRASAKRARSGNWLTQIYGLEANDAATRNLGPAYTGLYKERRKPWMGNFTNERLQADAVLLLDRNGCAFQQSGANIHKMWTNYIDTFPHDKWHEDVERAIGTVDRDYRKLRVGYIDRQNSRLESRRLPDDFHNWLVEYLSSHPKIDFLHLHMQDYEAIEQIRIASSLDVIAGAHGNGLSHALWMKPHRYVIESFWNYPFHFDYATTAQLLRHSYLGILHGLPIDSGRILNRDTKLMSSLPRNVDFSNPKKVKEDLQQGKAAIERFLMGAMEELHIL